MNNFQPSTLRPPRPAAHQPVGEAAGTIDLEGLQAVNETGTIEAQITPLLALLQNWGAGSDVLQAATNGCLLYQGVTTPAALAECDNPQISALSLDYGEYLTASQQKPAALAQLFLAGYRDPRLAILIAADLWCHQTLCRQPARASAQDPKSRPALLGLLDMLGMWQLRKELEVRESLPKSSKARARADDRTREQRLLFDRIADELAGCLPTADLKLRDNTNTPIGAGAPTGVIGINIIMPDEAACYAALGIVHRWGRPSERGVLDYIAASKVNGYRCLHTTVTPPPVYGNAPQVRFFIQSAAMQEVNYWGAAAIFMREHLQEDLPNAWWSKRSTIYPKLCAAAPGALAEPVCVFSPQGQVFEFPRGATLIDYAYQVHSELANQCELFRVNGEVASPTRELRHLDIVELERNVSAPGPTPVWHAAARTSRARQHVERFLKQRRGVASSGRALLDRRLGMLEQHYGFTIPQHRIEEGLLQAVRRLELQSVEHLLQEVASQRIPPDRVLHSLFADELVGQIELPAEVRLYPHQIRLCQSCRPRLSDEIRGRWRVRGENKLRGLTVHTLACRTPEAQEATMVLHWRLRPTPQTIADIEIITVDEAGLLGSMLQSVYKRVPAVTLLQVTATAHRGAAKIRFTVEAAGEEPIQQIVQELEALPPRKPDSVRRVHPHLAVLERFSRSRDPLAHNPYGRSPVSEREMLIGRDAEINQIRDHLSGPTKLVFLRGRKRIGKTSLLWALRDYELEKNRFVPCYVDFQFFSGCRDETIWYRIAEASFQELHRNRNSVEISPPLRELFETAPAQQLASYWQRLQAYFAPRRLVFLFDEFSTPVDSLQGAEQQEFFTRWRGLLQAISRESGFLLVVQQRALDIATEKGETRETSPLWQLLELGNNVLLEPLTSADTVNLITRPVRSFISYTPDALVRALDYTGYSPFIVQAFCYGMMLHMADQTHHEVTLEDVEVVAAKLYAANETLFEYILQSADGRTHEICIELARLAGPYNAIFSLDEIQFGGGQIERPFLERILQALTEQGVIKRINNHAWQFTSLLFQRWTLATAGHTAPGSF